MSFLRNTALYTLAQRIATLDEGLVFEVVFNDKVITDEIIELNTIEQLFKKGIDSQGSVIGKYSKSTENRNPKKKAGSNYTLEDTGDFYKSFRVTAK